MKRFTHKVYVMDVKCCDEIYHFPQEFKDLREAFSTALFLSELSLLEEITIWEKDIDIHDSIDPFQTRVCFQYVFRAGYNEGWEEVPF